MDKLRQALKGAVSIVFINFKGLTVGKTTEMRRILKDAGISYSVAKKTLTKRVLEENSLGGEAPELPGELSLAWGLPEEAGKKSDPLAPAREVYGFQKKYPENLNILGGIFDGKYMSKGEIEEIAKIPILEVLRGKFVNIINSPIQRFAIALNEVAKIKS